MSKLSDEAKKLFRQIRATDGAEVHCIDWPAAEELVATGAITLSGASGPERAFRRAELTSYGRGPTWTTRDGRVLRTVEMEDSHLLNTIRFLRRKCITIDELFSMWRYVGTAPDGAALAVEQELEHAQIMPAIWDDLVGEAKRRGLAWEAMP